MRRLNEGTDVMAATNLASEHKVALARAPALNTRAIDLIDAGASPRKAAVFIDMARRELCEVLDAVGGGIDELWAVNLRVDAEV